MIKRILIVLLLVVLGGYFVIAITFFNKPAETETCQSVNLSVNDSVRAGFIDSHEIEQILKARNLYPLGKKITEINTREIVDALQENPLISQALCYRSATGKICIEVSQRLPVLRILSENGINCYVDGKGHIMKPDNTRYTAHLVIVTGEVTTAYIKKLLPLGRLIREDAFWSSMIEQIHITASGDVELIPRVGDHIVFLGKPEKFQDKLHRLRLFYEKGLSQIGWNKYSRINLEFGNQIICTKKK